MTPHVKKIRVPVLLAQPHQDPCEGWFLLDPRYGPDDRQETIVELLNSSRAVLPFIRSDDGAILLLTRINIDWVAIGDGAPRDQVHPPGLPNNHRQQVELRFVDDRRVEGVIEWRGERDDLRLSDFLNASATFIAMRAGFGTLVANTTRIRETRIAAEASADRPLPPVTGAHAARE